MSQLHVGIMSGTSLDGADAALVEWPSGNVHGFHSLEFAPELRAELLSLCSAGYNEIERSGRAAVQLAQHYALLTTDLLAHCKVVANDVASIGCHGQTVRHCPDVGFTVQLQNPALLAELSGISVVADFRSRDLAAGGQGAPLAPAFHEAVFSREGETRAVINIGGISNASVLNGSRCIAGFDCGPGNVLMDYWAQSQLGAPFDKDGAWAASAQPNASLLQSFLQEAYFAKRAPKSTGRELFNAEWLASHLQGSTYSAAEIQATLLELTALSIQQSLQSYGPFDQILICGGGAKNDQLMARLSAAFRSRVTPTDAVGIPAQQVEAIAFSWLAYCAVNRQQLTLGHITGSRHPVILGAIYPA